MTLGIIGWISEDEFQSARDRGLEFIELDVNDRDKEFLEKVSQIKSYSFKYNMPIAAVGRWGMDKITASGILEEELAVDKKLMDAASELGADVYMTGCNYIESLSFEQNCALAITYLQTLVDHGKEIGVKVATYNCRWNNFIHSEKAWEAIHGQIGELKIKYDPSHCIYAGGDYLKETRDWAERFGHVHLKGSLVIDKERFDDPPAGLDQTDWASFLAILYVRGYEGGLSIEPHSAYWKGELGKKGVDYTVQYMRRLML